MTATIYKIKQPGQPASRAQRNLICELSLKLNEPIPTGDLTMADAHKEIERLIGSRGLGE